MMEPIAEAAFDLFGSDEKVRARSFAPERHEQDWACTFEIDPPISVLRTIYGVSSKRALYWFCPSVYGRRHAAGSLQNAQELELTGLPDRQR